MSDTPRTDAFLNREHVAHDGMWCDFARELERENTQLRDAAQVVYDRLNGLGCFTDEQDVLRQALMNEEWHAKNRRQLQLPMLEAERQIYATVDEVIAMLKSISEAGKGHYLVGCNSEYWLARKDEEPSIHDPSESVDMGGYC